MFTRRAVAAVAALISTMSLGVASTATAAPPAQAAPAQAAPRSVAATTHVHIAKTHLLRAHDFTDHGFARARVTTMVGDGMVSTWECDGPYPTESRGYRGSRGQLYEGAQTDAVETVAQFRHSADAKAYVKAYRKALDGCQAMLGTDLWRTTSHQHPQLRGASSADYWIANEDTIGITNYRTISVVRRGARVGVLLMESTTSRPNRTTNVPAVMQDMAHWLR